MSRLIDADKLIEDLKENYDDCDIQDMLDFFGISECIKRQPTAFDVDKVVTQLEALQNVELSKRDSLVEEELEKIEDCNDCDDWYEAGHFEGSVTASVNTYLKAIEIVKAGGRDD